MLLVAVGGGPGHDESIARLYDVARDHFHSIQLVHETSEFLKGCFRVWVLQFSIDPSSSSSSSSSSGSGSVMVASIEPIHKLSFSRPILLPLLLLVVKPRNSKSRRRIVAVPWIPVCVEIMEAKHDDAALAVPAPAGGGGVQVAGPCCSAFHFCDPCLRRLSELWRKRGRGEMGCRCNGSNGGGGGEMEGGMCCAGWRWRSSRDGFRL